MRKKTLVLLTALIGTFSLFAQTGKGALAPATSSSLLSHETNLNEMSQEKTLSCVDTIRYPQAKEQIIGTNNFYSGFGVWQADNESVSQAFLNSGNLSITGVEFFGAKSTDALAAATVTVNAAIYNVDANFVPTTIVGSGNVTITATTYGYRYVTFASPITVTGNYAVILKPTNTNGILNLYVNDIAAGQSYDELFTRFFSAYASYPNPNNWNTIPTFEGGGANYEPLIAPLVNYSINTNFNASATTVCQGTAVTYTNTSTPVSAFNNRMLNYQIFRTYFGLATSDSTFVYDMDNLSPYIWSGTTTYTHPAAGTYDVLLGTNGGFWNSCFDFTTQTITVNPIPAAPTVTPGGPTTFCAGGSVTLTSSSATGNTWSTGETTQSITVNSGSTVTVTATALGCTSPSSTPQTITVTPLDNANYNYPTNSICSGSSNQTPTTSVAGSFSSTPAGLTFVSATTGEIDVLGSAVGTYTVTYTTSGTCPNTSNQTITITTAPDANFTYANAAYCSTASNPLPVFGGGASAGVFSSTPGLNFVNTNTGEINLATSTPGAYVVTNTIAASGACAAASQTFNVTVNESPSATISGGATFCDGGSTPISIALTGSAPWTVTYSDGTNIVTDNATVSPYIFNAVNVGTYTVSNVTSGGCSNTGTGSAVVVINPNPTVTVDPVAPLCDNVGPVVLTATPVGGVFSGTSVSAGNFDPTIGAGSYTVTYDYTDGNGCAGSSSAIVLVNASPVVTQAPLTDVCLDANAFTLTGGLPAGGTYTGTGVAGGLFDPAVAGDGSTAITYSVTNGSGCSSSATESILVNDCAGIDEITAFDLVIAPNPANTTLYITSNESVQISLVSIDGKTVIMNRELQANSPVLLDVTGFARGVYYLQVVGRKNNSTKSIVLN
ncbi:MAG: T9SS type A sorting domain-containing protein [Fluviicola sp.]|nr:T9SS type A sorting domain-containing protein [Fluviicola sp.]